MCQSPRLSDCGIAPCHRLFGIALQPEGRGQRDICPAAMIESEIDRTAFRRSGQGLDRGLEFGAGAPEIACEVEMRWSGRLGFRFCHCGRGSGE